MLELQDSRRRRMLAWLLALATVFCGTFAMPTLINPTPVLAQDAPSADSAAPQEGKRREESLLEYYYRSLGLFYTIAFLVISFCFVAVVVMCFLMLRRDQIIPPVLTEAFEARLNEKKFQEAFDLAKGDPSLLGQVLAAGLGKLQSGYDQALEAMSEVAEDESMKMDHKMGYVSLIAAISPMVGLLGTVDGMTNAFIKISQAGGKQPEADKLADDIGTALVTTLVGLWIAIPAMAFFTFFKNRAARLMLEMSMITANLMGRFQSTKK